MEQETDEIKTIFLPDPTMKKKTNKKAKNKEITKPKEVKMRQVTKTSSWVNRIKEEDLDHNRQLSILENPINKTDKKQMFVYGQMKHKLNSYKHQDLLKNKYNEGEFMDVDSLKDLILESQLKCFYCKEEVNLLYEAVRDPKQWTLERIDNKLGHNKGNVEICCLSCNIKRKTMYYEKYRFTKQIRFEKEVNG